MAIRVVCPQCAKVLQAPDEAAGKRARCRACQAVVVVPSPPTPAEEEVDEYRLAEPVPSPAALRPPAPRPPAPPTPAPRSPASTGSIPQQPTSSTTGPHPPKPMTDSSSQRAAVPPPRPTPTSAIGPRTSAAAAPVGDRPTGSGLRRFAYLLFALALVPLGVSMFHAEDNIEERVLRTISQHPEIAEKIDTAESEADLYALLPGGRFEGAHLSKSTWVHWLYAFVSAAAFLSLILVAFGSRQVQPTTIGLIGLCTATFGIVFLVSLQFLAAASQGVWLRGGSIVVVIFYIVKLIGFSYTAALDDSNGFLLSFFGYTIGVGLCEELTKALPILFRCRDSRPFTWRAAVMWGLASGVGFGVAEGIMYSSRHYNGITGGEIYLVRFISCVALHAVWTATVALLIWNNQANFQADEEWPNFCRWTLGVLGAPMVLHGLYDTMLKKDMQVPALGVAVVSFLLLVGVVEYTRHQQD